MTDKAAVIRAVLDTNDFLEHRRFTEVPWGEILNAERVVLVVPWKVVAELDSNKSNNRSSTKRERARALLPLIERFSQIEPDAEVRPGVTMEYFHGNVDEVCRQHDLTTSQADHLIIASALLLQEKTSDMPVVLVTGDTGMRMTARRVGVNVIPMPEEYRLSHALDDEERERRQTERELQRIQSRRPELRIGWGEDRSLTLKTPLSPVQRIADEQVDVMVSRRIERLRQPKPYFTVGGKNIANPDYDSELERIEKFTTKYRRYLRSRSEYEATVSMMVRATISVLNSGTKAATDVRLELTFPKDVILLEEEPKPPTQPSSPDKSTSLGFGLGALATPRLFAPTIPDLNVNKNVTSWVATEQQLVVLRIKKLQQSYSAATDEFFVVFPDKAAIRPLQVDYHLVADELLEPIEGRLALVTQIAASSD